MALDNKSFANIGKIVLPGSTSPVVEIKNSSGTILWPNNQWVDVDYWWPNNSSYATTLYGDLGYNLKSYGFQYLGDSSKALTDVSIKLTASNPTGATGNGAIWQCAATASANGNWFSDNLYNSGTSVLTHSTSSVTNVLYVEGKSWTSVYSDIDWTKNQYTLINNIWLGSYGIGGNIWISGKGAIAEGSNTSSTGIAQAKVYSQVASETIRLGGKLKVSKLQAYTEQAGYGNTTYTWTPVYNRTKNVYGLRLSTWTLAQINAGTYTPIFQLANKRW